MTFRIETFDNQEPALQNEQHAAESILQALPNETLARTRPEHLVLLLDGSKEDAGIRCASLIEKLERDLELRSEGDVLGASQSGRGTSLRLLRVVRDADVIARARADAEELVGEDPTLETWPGLAAAVRARLAEVDPEFLERA